MLFTNTILNYPQLHQNYKIVMMVKSNIFIF